MNMRIGSPDIELFRKCAFICFFSSCPFPTSSSFTSLIPDFSNQHTPSSFSFFSFLLHHFLSLSFLSSSLSDQSIITLGIGIGIGYPTPL